MANRKFDGIGTVFLPTDSAPAHRVMDWSALFRYVGVTETDLEDRAMAVSLTNP